MNKIEEESQNFRDSIATIDHSGKRNWIYVKKIAGKWFRKRKNVAFLLITLLVLGPFLKINGNQFFLFNVLERKFLIFGIRFWPQDFHLLVISMLLGILFVVLFTVIYGRLFCGWVCPQTIFLEMVFRPIEYWIEGDRGAQIRLNKQAWNLEKIFKKGTKWFIYFVISFLISNVFLAYFIGGDVLINNILNPEESFMTLAYLLIFTGVFFFVFAWFREQVCVIACPYGRLQGVLLDKNSIVVAYDYLRGEKTTGRAKFKKKENREETGKGDCIDCKQCVAVCPTGIDIRDGTQLECVNCTACMDACDQMMEHVGLPKQLIRYASEDEIAKGNRFSFTLRVKAYTMVLSALCIAFVVLMTLRNEIEATILRLPGQLYQTTEDKKLQNVFTFSFINKTAEDIPQLELRIMNLKGTIKMVSHSKIDLLKEAHQEGTFFVTIDPNLWEGKKLKLKIGIYQGNRLIEKTTTHFLGPQTYQ